MLVLQWESLCCRQFIARGGPGPLHLCSAQGIHAFVCGREYRAHLLPC